MSTNKLIYIYKCKKLLFAVSLDLCTDLCTLIEFTLIYKIKKISNYIKVQIIHLK